VKLIKRDFRHETKIKPETLDDLWNLAQILREGDTIGARTFRTLQASASGEKKPVFLKILAEKITHSENGHSLRVAGRIIDAPEDFERGHHTLSIEPGTIFSVEKDWADYEIRKLKDALTYKGMNVLICVMDERRADFAHASELRVKEIATIKSKSGGKMYGSSETSSFYAEVSAYLKENVDKYDKIIIAGPGFSKENIYKTFEAGLKKKCNIEASSITGKTGINEVIKRGALERVVAESRMSSETRMVEDFLAELGKESGFVTYGAPHVKKAVDAGAANSVMVSDKLVRQKDIQKVLETAEAMKAETAIISSTHEAGEKLLALGGIAAFLRYKFEEK